jgi:nucleoside-diphosphate-sugar epimerase
MKMRLDQGNVLVTGGAGFVGSNLSESLHEKGCKLTILDNLSNGFKENIPELLKSSDVELVTGDIRDLDVCIAACKDKDVVFHEAAQINPALAVEKPFMDFEINAVGTLNMLEAARKNDVKKFVFASTNVYADPKYLPIDEEHPINLLSPYAASKLSGEAYCMVYNNTYGLRTVRLRNTNIYGPRQRSTKNESGAVTIFIEKVLKNETPTIFGDGNQTRDFIYVSDVVRANILAAESDNSAGEVFNIGYGRETSINDLAKLILKIAGKNSMKINYAPQRAADFRRCVADISKAKKILGFGPKVDLESGLEQTIKWWKEIKELK